MLLDICILEGDSYMPPGPTTKEDPFGKLPGLDSNEEEARSSGYNGILLHGAGLVKEIMTEDGCIWHGEQ